VQGFSKEITLDRAIWAGYIKDYEGGTIMQVRGMHVPFVRRLTPFFTQCTMLPKVNYLETRDILAKQREVRDAMSSFRTPAAQADLVQAILTKIREMSDSHIVYKPLPQFVNAKAGEEVNVDWQDVPGLRELLRESDRVQSFHRFTGESGWTPSMIETYVTHAQVSHVAV
jgi:histone acetyltransferase